MSIIDALKLRRSVYKLGENVNVSDEEIIEFVTKTTELVPDAFNMRSQRVVLALGKKHKELWDEIYNAFGGKVSREKIDGFKSAYGTVLYLYDDDTVKALQEKFPAYAQNFPLWANHANGMLQISIWTGLREMNLGANIQHYNPVIDDAVRKLFDLPENYKLVAQMIFGNIIEEPAAKDTEDISLRVKVAR